MIIVDTNVVFEAMKPAPDTRVSTWLNNQAAESLYLTSVTVAELLYGVAALPAGKRKTALDTAANGLVRLFDNRILDFDTAAARAYAEIAAVARAAGRGLPLPDGYIAAIASAKGFKIATRDTAPFLAAGVAVIDPWENGAE